MTTDIKSSSSQIGKILASGQLASGESTVYTVQATTAVSIASAALCNTSGSPVTVSVSVVPSGGAVDGTHRVISGYSLAAGDSTTMPEIVGALLDTGALISMNASAGSAVNYLLTGVVYS